jgi:hypothetical protein
MDDAVFKVGGEADPSLFTVCGSGAASNRTCLPPGATGRADVIGSGRLSPEVLACEQCSGGLTASPIADVQSADEQEICIHFGLVDKPPVPHTGVPLTSQISSRDVPDWKVAKVTTRLRDMPSNTYTPRGKREDWSREQYAVYRQERDIHLMTQRVARYKAGYEASEKRKASAGQPIEHPPVKDGTATRQVIGVVNGSRPGEKPFGARGEAGDQHIARYDHEAYERRLARGEWSKATLDELEAELRTLIREAEHPPPEADDAPREPWSVPSTPETDSKEDDVYAFDPSEWGENGYKIIHDFWPSMWRAKAVASLYEKRINKTVRGMIVKSPSAHARLPTTSSSSRMLSWRRSSTCLRWVHLSRPTLTSGQPVEQGYVSGGHTIVANVRPRRLFLETAVEALAFRVHGGPVGHALYQWVSIGAYK